MIIEQEKKLEITSSVNGEEIAMTIDADATEHLLGVLTNLYSDPMLAVIREISCNAQDAHIAAGNKSPIRVTLPTNLNPMFIVRDEGTGLDIEDFRHVYTRYGKSTKRDTNEQTGSFGLGCKAPLTYTDQFTVVGIKNKIKTNAIVGRNEKDMPTLTVVSQTPTDEANGVTVMVAVKSADIYVFIEKANNFFKWWTPGTILVNGLEPAYPEIERTIANVDIYSSKNTYSEGVAHLVMGNVSYPIREHFNIIKDFRKSCVIKAPLGSVRLTPNREDLIFTKKTIAYLKMAEDAIIADYTDRGRKEILAVKKWERSNAIKNWNDQFNNYHSYNKFILSSKDFNIPSLIEFTEPDNGAVIVSVEGRSLNETFVDRMDYLKLNYHLIIENFDGKITPYIKKKIRYYFDQKGIKYGHYFVLVKNKINAAQREWINPSLFYDFAVIKDIKIPRTPKGQGQTYDTLYKVWQADGTALSLTIDQINAKKYSPIVYSQSSHNASIINLFGKHKAAVIHVSGNQINRIERKIHGEVVPYRKLVDELSTKWWNKLSKAKKTALQTADTNFVRNIRKILNVDEVLDPEIKKIAKEPNVNLTETEKTLYRNVSRFIDIEPIDEYDVSGRYPLLSWYTVDEEIKKHNTIYVNSIWKELYK